MEGFTTRQEALDGNGAPLPERLYEITQTLQSELRMLGITYLAIRVTPFPTLAIYTKTDERQVTIRLPR